MIEWQRIEDEYRPDETRDDDRMLELKSALFSKLNEVERKIFIYYAELGSYAAVARVWRTSPPTVRKKIEEIKNKLK